MTIQCVLIFELLISRIAERKTMLTAEHVMLHLENIVCHLGIAEKRRSLSLIEPSPSRQSTVVVVPSGVNVVVMIDTELVIRPEVNAAL